MRLPIIAVSTLVALFSSQINAQAVTEHVFDEIPLGSPIFLVDCIGMEVVAPLTALSVAQSTVTPSGRLHYHENWRVYGIWMSADGYEWAAFGQWPDSTNLKLAEGGQTAVRGKLKIIAAPIDDNPYPKLKTTLQYKIIRNANGEVVIDQFADSPPKCFGETT